MSDYVTFNRYKKAYPYTNLVQGIWWVENSDNAVRFPLVADGYPELILQVKGKSAMVLDNEEYIMTGLSVVGLVDKPFTLTLAPNSRFVSVKLMPWALPYIIKDKAEIVNNKVENLSQFQKIVLPNMEFFENKEIDVIIKNVLFPMLDSILNGFTISKPLLPYSISELYRNVQILKTETEHGYSGSIRYYQKLYKENVGISPLRFKRLLKIKKASLLILEDSQTDMYSLGLSLGYFDQSHFSKDFRIFTGVSPSQFAARAERIPIQTNFDYRSQYEYS